MFQDSACVRAFSDGLAAILSIYGSWSGGLASTEEGLSSCQRCQVLILLFGT